MRKDTTGEADVIRLRQDISSLKRIVCGGAPLSLMLRQRLQEAFPHVQILEAYGLTEAGPAVTVEYLSNRQ